MALFSALIQARREPQAVGSPFALFWAVLAGICLPCMFLMFGVIAVLLDLQQFPTGMVQLGTYLEVPLPIGLMTKDVRYQFFALVFLTFVVAAVFSFAVWMSRRMADARTRCIMKSLHKRVLQQCMRRSEIEGAAAQRERARQLINKQLPDVGRGLALWYRSMPRSAVALVGCILLAVMIDPWLTLFAVICGLAMWRLQARLRHPESRELSRYEIQMIRDRLVGLIGDSPMMARLQAGEMAERSFTAELEALDRRIGMDDAQRGRVWPVLVIAASISIAVLVLGLGANSLGVEPSLNLPAAMVLGLALFGAAISGQRLVEMAKQMRHATKACDGLYLFLQHRPEISPSEQRVGLMGLRDAVQIENVTLKDPVGHPILRDLSLVLRPKSMVSLLGTDDISSRTLVELLMGFGRPNHGKVKIDGISMLDVHPMSLAKQVMWVGPDGPLWEASVSENLMAGVEAGVDVRDMVQILERLGVYERITRLNEGLETIVQPDFQGWAGDDGFGIANSYALGIARAMLHQPPIVLVYEPPAPTEHVSDDPCLACLRELADTGSLVVVLPHRLNTLRSSDRVVLLNGPDFVGEGRHADLLGTSDLYRHLNYLLFNPYRHKRQ